MKASRIYHVPPIQYWLPEIPNSLIVKSILTLYMFPVLMLYLDFIQEILSIFLISIFSIVESLI